MDLEKLCGNCGRWIQATYRRVGYEETLCVEEEGHCPWFKDKSANSKPEGFCWIPLSSPRGNAHQDLLTHNLQKTL